MPDATGTPSANYSIPKLLTNTDRPTGQGLNTIVDFIDSLLFNSATLIGAKARVNLRKNSGADVGARRRINLIEGSGISLTLADDAANEEVDVTIAANVPSELAYVEFTSSVAVSSTVEATPNDIVSSGTISYDGSPVVIEFFSPLIEATATLRLSLWDGATNLGFLGQFASTTQGGNTVSRRLTPSVGSHTYKVTAHSPGGGSGTVYGGTGGAGFFLPGFIRVSKA